MINSPLEQFNILSVYDGSLINASIFEIVYIKGLFLIWYIFYNLPETILLNSVLLNNTLAPLYSALHNILYIIPTLIVSITLMIDKITNLDSATYQGLFIAKFSFFLLMGEILINYAFDLYNLVISSIWYQLYSWNNDMLMNQSNIMSDIEDIRHKSALLNLNYSLICSGLGIFLTNMYFTFIDISLWAWAHVVDSIILGLLSFLSISTNDFSYLILSLNTSTLWLTLGFILTTFLLSTILSSITLLPKNNWQTVLEMFYQMVLDVVNENAGIQGRKYFPLIFTTFLIILFCNLLGMIPYSFTVTSHIIVTFSMALAIFVGINILGILKNGTHFLSLFFPPGAPLALAPLLVFIEFISYTFRVLSLSIRLFANLMSGHTLLKILSTFGWAAVSFLGIFIIPLIIIFLVTGLELAIGFLQAYIFSVLLCIYINEAFNLH